MRFANRFVVTSVLTLLGCGPDIDLGERPQFNNGTSTMTFIMYDGVSGAGVSDASLSIRVGPHNLGASRSGNIYTITQVPVGTFPVFAEAEGYLDFSQNVTASSGGSLANPLYSTFYVLMFPNENLAKDVVVKVFENVDGNEVSSGRVVVALNPAASIPSNLGLSGGSVLASNGFRPAVVVADLQNGEATLGKEQMVFGATYRILVYSATNAAGDYLQPPASTPSFTAGQSFDQIVIYMGPPAITPSALSANNEEGGINATLVVNFPYPVELCHDPLDPSWFLQNSDTDNDLITILPADPDPVGVALSNQNTTLTLTPNVENGTADPDDELVAIFSGIRVGVVGATGCTDLFSVTLRGSSTVVDDTITVQEGD